jgi:dipicolinate synthase subunit A
MSATRVAVLGGDAREVYIAGQLCAQGHQVALFGVSGDGDPRIDHAASAEEAVSGASWIVCPSPGLGAGDRVYAPGCTVPITLDGPLLAASRAADGGLVLGRATPGVVSAARTAGVQLFEMKDDRSLAIANATAVAEALLALLIGKTERVLPEHRFLILGYGATGAAVTDALLGLACPVGVAARRSEHLERARQRGAVPAAYPDRLQAMSEAGVVINTVPSPDAILASAFPTLHGVIVVDIASPPGGTDHQAARDHGLDITWARGLAGARAPLSAGDAQLRVITDAMAAAAQNRRPAGSRPAPA